MYFILLHAKETNSFSQNNVDRVAKSCWDKKNPWDEKNPVKEIIMQDNFFEKQFFLWTAMM